MARNFIKSTEHLCLFCGAVFEQQRKKQCFCCTECYNEYKQWRYEERQKIKRQKAIEAHYRNNPLDDVIKAANEAGISYGKYQEAKWQKRK